MEHDQKEFLTRTRAIEILIKSIIRIRTAFFVIPSRRMVVRQFAKIEN